MPNTVSLPILAFVLPKVHVPHILFYKEKACILHIGETCTGEMSGFLPSLKYLLCKIQNTFV